MRKIQKNRVKKIKRFWSYNYTYFREFSESESEWNFTGNAFSCVPKNVKATVDYNSSILKDYMESPNSYNRAIFRPGDKVWLINDRLEIAFDFVKSIHYYGAVGSRSLITYTLVNHSCGSSGDCEHGDLFPNRKAAEFWYPYIRINAMDYSKNLHQN